MGTEVFIAGTWKMNTKITLKSSTNLDDNIEYALYVITF